MHEIKINLKRLKVDYRLIARLQLEDGRTKELCIQTIAKLTDYCETPRIRKNLPENFILHFDCTVDDLIFKLDGGDNPGNIEEELENLYTLLYIQYPEVHRKFKECLRRRSERLNDKGQTKWEARRISKARKKGAETRKANSEESKELRSDRLAHLAHSIMNKTR